MFSALILAVGLTGQSGIGEPPANASPELRALYKQVNTEAAAARSSRAVAPAVAPAPVPAPVGQLPIPAVAPARKQVKLNTVNQPRLRPPDLRDFDVGPSWAFRAHRRSSRRVADWCRDRGTRPR